MAILNTWWVNIIAYLICAISVMLNIVSGYFFLKERESLMKKVIAGILIIISVVLINVAS